MPVQGDRDPVQLLWHPRIRTFPAVYTISPEKLMNSPSLAGRLPGSGSPVAPVKIAIQTLFFSLTGRILTAVFYCET